MFGFIARKPSEFSQIWISLCTYTIMVFHWVTHYGSSPYEGIWKERAFKFDVQRSVHRKCIPFGIFPTRCNITQFIYFWETALHVLGGISTHHQEHTLLYLQCLVLVNRYCYLPLLWEIWSWPECGDTTLRPAPNLPQVNTVVCVPDDGWRNHPKNM